MIRRFGRETLSTYCQTLNGCERVNDFNNIDSYEYIFFSVDLFW